MSVHIQSASKFPHAGGSVEDDTDDDKSSGSEVCGSQAVWCFARAHVSDDPDDSDGNEAVSDLLLGTTDGHDQTARAARSDETDVSEGDSLPAPHDLDALAAEGGAFLHVPRITEDPTWRMTPAQQQATAASSRAAKRASSAAVALPMNKYGRGMNLLQLGVELSARAASRGAGSSVRRHGEPPWTTEVAHDSRCASRNWSWSCGQTPSTEDAGGSGKSVPANTRTSLEDLGV